MFVFWKILGSRLNFIFVNLDEKGNLRKMSNNVFIILILVFLVFLISILFGKFYN